MMKIELALSKDKLLAREPNVSFSGGEPKRERIFQASFTLSADQTGETYCSESNKNSLFL